MEANIKSHFFKGRTPQEELHIWYARDNQLLLPSHCLPWFDIHSGRVASATKMQWKHWQMTRKSSDVLSACLFCASEHNKLLQEKHKQCLEPSLNMLLELDNFRQEQKRIWICQKDEWLNWKNWMTQKLWSSAITMKIKSSQRAFSAVSRD